jgi:hypothetical protein
MTTSNGGAALQALMAIADRYARRLVASPDAPMAVLLIERAGDLDVVMLGDEPTDAIAEIRLLLGQSGATSAALLVEVAPAAFWIFGESIDGTTARRRYRIRPCLRTRRLTSRVDVDDPEVEGLFSPLFPVHIGAEGADDGTADAASTAAASTAAASTAGPSAPADAEDTTGQLAAG